MPEILPAARRELLIMFLPLVINSLEPDNEERRGLEDQLKVIKEKKTPFDENSVKNFVEFRKSSSLVFREKKLERPFKRLVLELKFAGDRAPPFSNGGRNFINAGKRIGVCALEKVPGTVVDYKNMLLVSFKGSEGEKKEYWELLARFNPAVYSTNVDDCDTDEEKMYSLVTSEQKNPAVPTRKTKKHVLTPPRTGVIRPREETQQYDLYVPQRPYPLLSSTEDTEIQENPIKKNRMMEDRIMEDRMVENRMVENRSQEVHIQENLIPEDDYVDPWALDPFFELSPATPPAYLFGLYPMGDAGLGYHTLQYGY